MLYMLGGVVFDVVPTNLDTVNRERGQDWAAKAIVGAQKPREAMGVADAPVTLFGKLFPHRFGMGGLEALAAMAEGIAPQMLIRGDGTVLGWHCVERVKEKHSYLDAEGVGRVIDVEITLTQSPSGAGAGAMMTLLQGLF
ncbi:MAG: phage tail protein [Roseiarcus sp.]|jgi:phage protein U